MPYLLTEREAAIRAGITLDAFRYAAALTLPSKDVFGIRRYQAADVDAALADGTITDALRVRNSGAAAA